MTLTRKEQFDKRRAEAFEGKGVRVDNITGVDIYYAGRHEKGSGCALCGTSIKHWYSLGLVVGNKTVHFQWVGSSCIESWAESLPVSAAQADIIAKLKLAVEECAKLKAQLREVNALLQRGRLDNEEGDALKRYLTSSRAIRTHSILVDISGKVFQFGSFASDKQSAFFRRVLDDQFHTENAPNCGRCGKPSRYRSGRYGAFYGCTSYPTCRWTQNVSKPKVASKQSAGAVQGGIKLAPKVERIEHREDLARDVAAIGIPQQLPISTGWDDPAEALDDDEDFAF